MTDGAPLAALPRSGAAREKLRERGQFWTPDWVAEAMVAWATKDTDHLLDPAVGPGAFFRAGKLRAAREGRTISLFGCELDPMVLGLGAAQGLEARDIAGVVSGDFMMVSLGRRFRAVVANPPYVRHHRLAAERKAELRAFVQRTVGKDLDGRAGLHVFFLIKALTLLEEGGRLAFIVPADIGEGRFAPTLWDWISREYRIEGVATFAAGASPFPGVDTNPVILLITRAAPATTLRWARVLLAGTRELLDWCEGDLAVGKTDGMEVVERTTSEAIATGLTRRPNEDGPSDAVPLGRMFKVLRGIATGDNDFFFMTSERMRHLDLPRELFRRAIGRTRDHTDGPCLTLGHLGALDRRGRPTHLLSLDRQPADALPLSVRDYLRAGEEKGLPQRPLIAQRNPWYRMETREPPPWLFAYLGRRSCRFIRNQAGAVPLTSFLCVYLRREIRLDHDAVTSVLNDEETLANLPLVAKSYGGGALKVEPRGLERLAIPRRVLRRHGLHVACQEALI